MNEQQLAAVKQALEVMKLIKTLDDTYDFLTVIQVVQLEKAIAALQSIISQDALYKMAEDAVTIGLSYNDWPKIGCVNHDCDQCKAVQEPVAWVNHGENRITRATGWDGYGALYTTPPAPQPVPVKTYHDGKPWPVAPVPDGPYSAPIKELWPVAPKPWRGLTDEEKASLVNSVDYEEYYLLVENVEAKLKELNK
jgi:hypothetical protein